MALNSSMFNLISIPPRAKSPSIPWNHLPSLKTFIDVISEQKYIPKTNIAPENRFFASKRKKVYSSNHPFSQKMFALLQPKGPFFTSSCTIQSTHPWVEQPPTTDPCRRTQDCVGHPAALPESSSATLQSCAWQPGVRHPKTIHRWTVDGRNPKQLMKPCKW